MFEMHIRQTEGTEICSIKIVTPTKTIGLQVDKADVTKRISEELIKAGY